MASFQFKKATKERAKLRLALHGPSGAGKTYSALEIATHLIEPGQRVALLDTERGSASKYASKFDFDVVEVIDNYHPQKCIDAIRAAAESGEHGAIIVDSGSHFWNGLGGFLSLVDAAAKKAAARGGKFDTFGAWKEVDPIYQALVLAITSAPIHVIMTLRAKQAYEKVEDKNGKSKIQKLGMAPQMRDDFQYEFDVEGMLNLDHDLVIGKTRCEGLDGRVFHKPGREFAEVLRAWLNDGAPATSHTPPEAEPTKVAEQIRQKAPATEETPPDYDAPETGPTPMFIAIGAQIEQAENEAELDALMAEAREAFKARLMTMEHGKQLGTIANRRKAALRGEAAA
jgi:hypothetical protein